MQPSGSPSHLERRSRLYEQWASLLSAGVPILRSLTVLSESAGHRRNRRMLRRIRTDIDRGRTLGEALERSRRSIPEFDRAVLAVGERTGRLESSLKLLAESCRQNAAMLRETISGAVYPLLVLHVGLLVFPISMVQSMVIDGAYMPFLIQKLRVFAVLYASLFFLLWIAPRLFGGRFRSLTEMTVRPIPWLGRGLRELSLARLAFALDVQLNAGIGVIEAWMMAADVCGSSSLRREILAWSKPLAQGATPGELLGRSRAFRGVFSEFYATGEMSGRLEDSLKRIQQHFEDSGRARLKTLARWTPRILYYGIMFYVGYCVIRFYSDYFRMLNALSG